MRRLIVIGGGIMGMATAIHALEAGLSVKVIERERVGRGATWAAAGMLGAQTELHTGAEVLSFSLQARAYWRDFAHQLETWSGMQTGYRQEGAYRAAMTEASLTALQKLADQHGAVRGRYRWVEDGFPLLPEAKGVLYFPDEGQVDARLTIDAMRQAFIHRGGELFEGENVTGYGRSDGGWQVHTESGNTFTGDQLLAAPGVAGFPGGKEADVHPVKGECLALRPDELPFQETLVTDDVYLVPKADGRIIIGATEQPWDTSRHVRASAVSHLLDQALMLVPALADAVVEVLWSGVRPRHNRGIPEVDEWEEGFFVSIGHYRNGILLSALTGKLLAEWMATGRKPPLMNGFKKEEITS
ncbi:NAD(P)/FAD-dependent oxidoreductase [Salisediminibacterium selenitireducens]|uniref:FAD dependent oxidoreductase n=1 Tax=Bacillus selenitireducens (strain ATCC 700615 / DSM 15326 / MLS10) TaxID=439292 RepID=D6XYC1_BACIE|nr:FAD-dependent oxidoreductase [Salisediminibacterium selenitireducens]ADI00190.1 FAD dependent oxidoreductase [[Bacillus] selenitireducens MLS10]